MIAQASTKFAETSQVLKCTEAQCLPNLDLELLASCLVMTEPKAALKLFQQSLQSP